MVITTFLFDLDGVLVDLCDLHRKIFIKAYNEYNSNNINSEFHDKYLEGLSTKEKLKKIEKYFSIEIDKELIYKKKQEMTIIELQEYEFTDRIKHIFEWVKAQNIRIAVYTNSIRKTLDLVLDRLDITDFVEYSLSNEDVIESKPSSFGYIKLMEMMNIKTCETMIFEDSICGKTSAYGSGAYVIPIINSLDITILFLDYCRTYLKRPEYLSKLRIVIPMAGLGSRFQKDGYIIQKPFLPMIGEKQLWEEVVENLLPKEKNIREKTDVHLIVRKEQLHLFRTKPNLYIHTVDLLTEGPACTVLTLKNIINDDIPLIIGNSDQYLEWSSDDFLSTSLHPDYDGCISTFYHPCPDDLKWSYASLYSDGSVKEVAEKKYIGPHATTGIYGWKKGSDFVKYAEKMILYNDRVNNEFYVCPVYNYAIKESKKIRILNCSKFWGVGIPKDYIEFIDHYKELSLSEKYESLWCKWGSRLPDYQPYFSSDSSICAAMWCKGSFHMKPILNDFKKALSNWNHKLVWYNEELHTNIEAILHHTFFQFHTFGIKQEEKKKYIPLIKKWASTSQIEMKKMPPYYLHFYGVAPTRTGIILCGYPPTNYNNIRTNIRNAYPCYEPHAQDIYHVTLARWFKPLDENEFLQITQIMRIFQHSYFGILQPLEWNYGFSTWCMKENTLDIIEKYNTLPSPWILHRGNSEGPSIENENNPIILYENIKKGWDIEIDVWKVNGNLYLGHDSPKILIDFSEPFLIHKNTWIHCKNLDAFFYFYNHPETEKYHFFSHDKDNITITSKGFIWGNIGIKLNCTGSINVINTKTDFTDSIGQGICTDWMP